MASNDKIIEVFNTQVLLLSKDITDTYRGNTKVATYASLIDKVIGKNYKVVFDNFRKYIYSNEEYRKNIIKGNESFFLSLDLAKLVGSAGNSEHVSDAIQFKNLWNDQRTTPQVKETMFRYFQVFVKLCEKYEQF